jgi:microcystin-dependent protein
MRTAGDVMAYGGIGDPPGWLFCDGRAISRSTFAALFAAIGEDYGNGDGTTTFNIPDMQGRFPRGGTPGDSGGTLDHDHDGGAHTHTVTQAATHSTHASQGAHAHDSHNNAGIGTLAGTNVTLNSPTTHVSQGAHTHNAHPAHTGAAINSGGGTTSGTANPPFQALSYIVYTDEFDLPADIDGGAPETTAFANTIDGGEPDTVAFGDSLDGGTP